MESIRKESQSAARRVADWLRALRANRGLSQEDVAFAAGVAVTTYARVERCVDGGLPPNPTLDTLMRVVLNLGVTPEEMNELVVREHSAVAVASEYLDKEQS